MSCCLDTAGWVQCGNIQTRNHPLDHIQLHGDMRTLTLTSTHLLWFGLSTFLLSYVETYTHTPLPLCIKDILSQRVYTQRFQMKKSAVYSHKPLTADMKRACNVGVKELHSSEGVVNTHSNRKWMAKPSAPLLSRQGRKHWKVHVYTTMYT